MIIAILILIVIVLFIFARILRNKIQYLNKKLEYEQKNKERFKILSREANEKISALFEMCKEGIIILNYRSEIIEINQSMLSMVNLSRGEIIGKNISFLLQDETNITKEICNLIKKKEISKYEITINKNSNIPLPVEVCASVIHHQNRCDILLVLTDVSSKQFESKLLQTVIKTEENARQYFSQELHDGLGPLLSASKMFIEWVSTPGHGTDPGFIFSEVQKMLSEANQTVRDISFRLSPYILNRYGLIDALNSYAEKVEQPCKLKITILPSKLRRLDGMTEIILYRVLCECINNTIKHAKANKVNINFLIRDKHLYVDYIDDGEGFDFENIIKAKKGIGFLNMESRLKSVNGSFYINSNIGHGTKISITVHLDSVFSKNKIVGYD